MLKLKIWADLSKSLSRVDWLVRSEIDIIFHSNALKKRDELVSIFFIFSDLKYALGEREFAKF